MAALRILLAFLWISIAFYTGIVVQRHGMSLFPVFFGDIAKLGWPGQFNFDFLCMLVLSATWVSWRHRFSPTGLALGLVALFGGAFFLTAYLLVVSLHCDGDAGRLLLGDRPLESR